MIKETQKIWTIKTVFIELNNDISLNKKWIIFFKFISYIIKLWYIKFNSFYNAVFLLKFIYNLVNIKKNFFLKLKLFIKINKIDYNKLSSSEIKKLPLRIIHQKLIQCLNFLKSTIKLFEKYQILICIIYYDLYNITKFKILLEYNIIYLFLQKPLKIHIYF